MPDEFQEAVDHFEDILDKEDAPPKPQRARKEPDDDDDRRQTREDQPEDEEDDEGVPPREPIDEEDEEGDGRPQPDEEEVEEEAALDLNQIVAVNVDGQRAEVSLQEALNGYVRAETFHRRLNQLGQVAQQIEAERAEVVQGREYYARMIPALTQQLLSLQPQEPDWDKLYADDPVEAARLERQWRAYREKMGQLAQEHGRVQAEQEQERQRQLAVYEDAQRRQLAQWVPDWADGKKWERDRRSMIRTAMAAGYSENELGELRDARATIVLLKAAKYDALMAAKPRPVKQHGAMRPGAISARGAAPNGLARAERRLQRTGNIRDAARAFEADLDREG